MKCNWLSITASLFTCNQKGSQPHCFQQFSPKYPMVEGKEIRIIEEYY